MRVLALKRPSFTQTLVREKDNIWIGFWPGLGLARIMSYICMGSGFSAFKQTNDRRLFSEIILEQNHRQTK